MFQVLCGSVAGRVTLERQWVVFVSLYEVSIHALLHLTLLIRTQVPQAKSMETEAMEAKWGWKHCIVAGEWDGSCIHQPQYKTLRRIVEKAKEPKLFTATELNHVIRLSVLEWAYFLSLPCLEELNFSENSGKLVSTPHCGRTIWNWVFF